MAWSCDSRNRPRVVADDPAPPVQFAAAELRRYTDRILGAGGAAPGAAAPVLRLAVTADPEWGEEGYRIAEAGGELRITGGSPRAVLYGAYEFLRRFGGCLFAGPAPDGEQVPRLPAIRFESAPVRMTPRFWYRGLQLYWNDGLDRIAARLDWMAKNGMNTVWVHVRPDDRADKAAVIDPETGERRGGEPCFYDREYRRHILPHLLKRGLRVHVGCHNLLDLLPPERHFQEHPEWYALCKGQRLGNPSQVCVCTSDPAMQAALARNVREFLRAHPEVSMLDVSPMDGQGGCECDACRALDGSPGDVFKAYGHSRTAAGENPSKSRRYARLVNHVARAVRQEFPAVDIGYTAYADLACPPRDMPLEPNVLTLLAIYWQCAAHPVAPFGCAVNRFYYELIRRWRASHGGRFVVAPYLMGMHAQRSLPYPISDMLIRDAQMFHALGVDGATSMYRDSHVHAYGLNHLVFARCGWWNHLDHGRLLDEYLYGMFGSAGRALRPIWDSFLAARRRIEQEFTEAAAVLQIEHADPAHPGGCLLPNGFNSAYFLDALGESVLDRCLEAARGRAAGERERKNLDGLAQAAAYWKAAARYFKDYHAVLQPAPGADPSVRRAAFRRMRDAARDAVQAIRTAPDNGWFYRGLDRDWERMLARAEQALQALCGETPAKP